jgi:hypothetical protein
MVKIIMSLQKERPKEKAKVGFLRNKFTLCLLSIVFITMGLNLPVSADNPNAGKNAAQQKRSFLMGFTPQPYDVSEEAYQRTYSFISDNADLIAHHVDEGVPWTEVLSKKAFHNNAEQDINRRLKNTKPGQKVYLALSPLNIDRKSLAGYWAQDSHAERPGEWKNRSFGDPEVIQAYIAYCKRMIERFKPSYLAYAIEVSDFKTYNPEQFPGFKKLLAETYQALKKDYKDLPVFLTFVLGDPGYMNERSATIKELLPYTDYFAVSSYPYVFDGVGGEPKRLPKDWFKQVKKIAPNKPFAVAETGFIAQTFWALSKLLVIPANSGGQKGYVEFLLKEAQELDAKFVIWFVPVDYDKLWKVMADQGADVGLKQWRDTGLMDDKFNPRPAMKVWQDWLALPTK